MKLRLYPTPNQALAPFSGAASPFKQPKRYGSTAVRTLMLPKMGPFIIGSITDRASQPSLLASCSSGVNRCATGVNFVRMYLVVAKEAPVG